MNKTKVKAKTSESLKVEFRKIITEFEEKHGFQFSGWHGIIIGLTAIFNDFNLFIDFSDIRLDIETDQPPGYFEAWFKKSDLDYSTWLMCH